MDVKKLSFAVDAGQIDIKPLLKKEFLELTMRAISTANPNRNKSWITRESMEASLDTFKNKPILGYFENGDFVSHNGEWKEDPETDLDYWDTLTGKGERPLGLIRSEDEVKIVDDEKTGLSWIVLTCALWTQYGYKQVKRLLQDAKRAKKQGGPTKNISVEVDITDYEMLPNGVMKINAFNLVGITILGSRNGVKVEPGIADAELSVVDIMGTDLYERQMKSLRLAYEKLDGSENKKEDFSKMEEKVQENSALTEPTEPAKTETEGTALEEGSQESAHFEENHADETSEPEEQHENEESSSAEPTEGQPEHFEENGEGKPEEGEGQQESEHCEEKNDGEEDEDDDEDDEEGEGEGEEKKPEHEAEEGVCPECGQNPCVCEHKDAEQESVHENEEVSQDVVRDVNWLISNCSWNIDDLKCAIGYYEANENIQGREYILPVLRRLLAQAIANEKELAELMGKVAEDITPEEIQMQEQLCDHCDCKAEFAAYNELLAKFNDVNAECSTLKQEKADKEAAEKHAQFVKDAKVMIANAKFGAEVSASFEKACEDGTIASLDDLKTQIGIKLYEITSATEAPKETTSFDAPVSTPNTSAFTEESGSNKKKSKWEALKEYTQKD